MKIHKNILWATFAGLLLSAALLATAAQRAPRAQPVIALIIVETSIPGPLGVAWHNEGYSAPIEQSAPLTPGQTYRVTYTITGSYTSTAPYHRARLRGTTAWATCPIGVGDGIFTCNLTAPTGAVGIAIQPSGGFAGVLDNVSVREVLP